MTRQRKTNAEARSREALKQFRLRVTRVRVSVLGTMHSSETPLSHRELVRRLARHDHDRATIFRTLTTLTRVGLLRRIDVGDHVWRFSLAETASDGQANFVCTECGHVELLKGVELRVAMTREPRAIANREIELHVHGRCDACSD
jgi:Fur family ferric uptake transcriptional regulator